VQALIPGFLFGTDKGEKRPDREASRIAGALVGRARE